MSLAATGLILSTDIGSVPVLILQVLIVHGVDICPHASVLCFSVVLIIITKNFAIGLGYFHTNNGQAAITAVNCRSVQHTS